MREFNFAVHVQGLDEENFSQIDVLFEAPFTIQPVFAGEEAELDVVIEGLSDHQAWQTFNRFILDRLPELHIIRVDLDLVNTAEIAERCGVSRETVRLWASGQRRGNFPASFTTSGQSKLWAWSDVFGWIQASKLPLTDVYSAVPLSIDFIESCNGLRAKRRHAANLSQTIYSARLSHSAWLNAGTVGGQLLTFVPRPTDLAWVDFATTTVRLHNRKLGEVGCPSNKPARAESLGV